MKERDFIVALTSLTVVLVVDGKHAFIIPPFVARLWKNRRIKVASPKIGLASMVHGEHGSFYGTIDERVSFVANGDTITWFDHANTEDPVLHVQAADYDTDSGCYTLGRTDIDLNFGRWEPESRRCITKDVRGSDACLVCNRESRLVHFVMV